MTSLGHLRCDAGPLGAIVLAREPEKGLVIIVRTQVKAETDLDDTRRRIIRSVGMGPKPAGSCAVHPR
jgi:hypothetical protein